MFVLYMCVQVFESPRMAQRLLMRYFVVSDWVEELM